MGNKKHQALVIALFGMSALIIGSKMFLLGYSFKGTTPRLAYFINLVMNFDGHGGPVRIQVPLPSVNFRQQIKEEMSGSEGFNFSIEQKEGNRYGVWEAQEVSGRQLIQYTLTALTRRVEYELPDGIKIPPRETYPPEVMAELGATELIQTLDPAVGNLAGGLIRKHGNDAAKIIREIYEFTAHKIKKAHFKGETSAVTTLQLGEGLCGGKARLFAALARACGIPARLMGGVLLKGGAKRVSHVWVEAFLGDQWVPFDPLNGQFAVLPENYLLLYYGDQPLFQHTKDINFKWMFKIKKRLEPPEEAIRGFLARPWNIFHFVATFRQAHISLTLLKIILMIPLGILVVVVFRNVAGLQTFGTFMPALMAVAFRDTGLFWGLAGFFLILAFGSLVRSLLDRLQLMYIPRLAILLTCVVFFMLTAGSIGVKLGVVQIAAMNLFPLAILTLTVERFCVMTIEQGSRKAFLVTCNSLLVAIISYLVMDSHTLQAVFLGFPELYLSLIAVYILLGSWTGLRLTEYVRFRRLLWN